MLNINFIIKYYLYAFLLIDSLSGFIRIYLGLSNPLFNIGYWVRGPLIFLLIFYYIIKLKEKKLYIDELLAVIIFLYFIFNMFLNYWINPSERVLFENITYILRQQFLILFLVYIRNRFPIKNNLIDKIMYINFFVLTINLLNGYFFGLGLEAYRHSGTSKGMFQGGNPVSILNLVFFSFFLLDGLFRKKILFICFSLLNGFIISSKSIFGFIIPIYFALKRRAYSINKIIFYTLSLVILFVSFSTVTGKVIELYESRFGINIKKSINAAEKVGGLYKNSILNNITSLNFRRYASLNIQFQESMDSIDKLIIGKSLAGQQIFWEKRGEFHFRHASMDFFDFLFRYGIIGSFLFFFILFWNFGYYKEELFTRDGLVYVLFFLYAFFGGHVIDSVTSGTLFYFFLGKLSQNKKIRNA